LSFPTEDTPSEDLDEKGKAYENVMKSRTVLWGPENELGRLPDDFLTISPSEQHKNVLTIIRAEKEKRQALVNLGIEYLHEATRSYGTANFSSPQRPAIQRAAGKAFDARGVKFYPLVGPDCDCGDKAEYRIVEIEVTAHGNCRTFKENDELVEGGLADL
jgi:hypothetical protein